MARILQLQPGEQLLSVAAAVAEVTGSKPVPTTLNRWVLKGVRGVVLPSVMVGGRRKTTLKAVREWVAEQSAAAVA